MQSIMRVLLLCFITPIALADHFRVMPLGTMGGELDANLSSYLVSARKSDHWVALDAGTFCSETKILNFKSPIQTYLISHAHLDHITGLVICATGDDDGKAILGLDSTINNLRDYIFNWKIWPNFANEGVAPQIQKYKYRRLSLGTVYAIPNTDLSVQTFTLSHGENYLSTAFLLQTQQYYLLYLGDTGADRVEKSNNLQVLWKSVAPIVKQKKLSAIFIESSYLNARPDQKLFGHLKPKWLLEELGVLATLVDPKAPLSALAGLPIVVTHIKQERSEKGIPAQMLQELNTENKLGVKFILPLQGHLLKL